MVNKHIGSGKTKSEDYENRAQCAAHVFKYFGIILEFGKFSNHRNLFRFRSGSGSILRLLVVKILKLFGPYCELGHRIPGIDRVPQRGFFGSCISDENATIPNLFGKKRLSCTARQMFVGSARFVGLDFYWVLFCSCVVVVTPIIHHHQKFLSLDSVISRHRLSLEPLPFVVNSSQSCGEWVAVFIML